MATNEILPFASTDTGTNLLTQAEYAADTQRLIGNQPGVARSKLVNKALRQSSSIAAAVAQFIANNQANNVVDTADPADIANWLEAAVRSIGGGGGGGGDASQIDYLPAGTGAVARTVQDKLREIGINVDDYGAVPDGVTDSTAAFQNAILNAINFALAGNRVTIKMSPGDYIITQGLSIPNHNLFVGLVGAGLDATNIFANIPAGQTALYTRAASAPLKDFTITAGLPGQSEAVARSIARNGINCYFYGGYCEHKNIRVRNFNGFGIRYEAIWDSNCENIFVYGCGNTTEWAFSVVSGNDTSNHTVFNRVQVEVAYDRAMLVDAGTLNCTFIDIHSERAVRTTGSNVETTHHLRGGSCSYVNARIESASGFNGARNRILLGGAVSTYIDFRCVDSIVGVQFYDGVSMKFENLAAYDLSVLFSTNVKIEFRGGRVVNNLVVDNFGNGIGACPRFKDMEITSTTIAATGTAAIFERCTFTNAIVSGGGNNIVHCYDCIMPNQPQIESVVLKGCTITGNATNSINSKIYSEATNYRGNVTLSQYGSLRGVGCRFDGDLLDGGGSAFGMLNACYMTKASPTVHENWYNNPAAFGLGATCFRPDPVPGGYAGYIRTQTSTRQFGLIT